MFFWAGFWTQQLYCCRRILFRTFLAFLIFDPNWPFCKGYCPCSIVVGYVLCHLECAFVENCQIYWFFLVILSRDFFLSCFSVYDLSLPWKWEVSTWVKHSSRSKHWPSGVILRCSGWKWMQNFKLWIVTMSYCVLNLIHIERVSNDWRKIKGGPQGERVRGSRPLFCWPTRLELGTLLKDHDDHWWGE